MRRTAAVMAGVLTLGSAAAAPATAAPPGRAPAPADAPAAPGRSVRITLITGDVVEVAPAGGGRSAATIHPAAGREQLMFHTAEIDGGLRVLPEDAIPYVASGAVDADLFDVEELIADGYADSSAAGLPLIVKYRGSERNQLRTLGDAGRELASIGGAALTADKASLATFWRTQAQPQARTLGGGIERIWLDGKVRPVLDRSAGQIGAPAAWQAGYDGMGVKVAVLDTGIDAGHSDLAGKLLSNQNFTDSPDTVDRHGHGTHVATTVVGTGAASGGSRKGVAPGASLVTGKVLNDDGIGYDSWIIAGMEWAVAQGASVVNMSLGGPPTDGTDPMSMALNRISDESGALFVVAAGNFGLPGWIGTPASANGALAVGAVDRDDKLASFSSRGPRLDEGLKPDITGPGVGIVAGRAAGTEMGQPVDERYTAASGTSMATPHVAGAAALVKQAHPEWTGKKLKDALVSTANTRPEQTVYEQGGGRVDVSRATKQQVHATGVADFGAQTVGGPVARRTITYTNSGTAPVTLSIKVDVRHLGNGTSETDALDAGPTTVTVPARGSVDAVVALNPARLELGQHGGWITATGPDGMAVTTAVGFAYDPPAHKLRIFALDHNGKTTKTPAVFINGDDPRWDRSLSTPKHLDHIDTDLAAGTYLLHGYVEHGAPLDEQVTLVTNPEFVVDRDMDVYLDARTGKPVRIETPKPAEQQTVFSFQVRRDNGNGRTISHGAMYHSVVQRLNVTPTKTPKKGTYEFSSRWQLVAPMVEAEVGGVRGPLDVNLLNNSPVYDGKRRFELAPPGAKDVRGKAALISLAEEDDENQLVEQLAAKGAAFALLVRPAGISAWTSWRPQADRLPVRAAAVAWDDGQRIIERARRGGAAIDLTLTVSSPYLYDVIHVERDRVPDEVVHRVTPSNTVRITARYAEMGGFNWTHEQRFGWRPWQTYSWGDTKRIVTTPSVREEWVSVGDSLWQHTVNPFYAWNESRSVAGAMNDSPRGYSTPTRLEETWYGPVVRPAIPKNVPGMRTTRDGDVLSLRVPEFTDSGTGHYMFGDAEGVSARLWRDGKLMAELPDAFRDVDTTAADARYRLALSTQRGDPDWIWGTRTETVWDFRSARTSGEQPLPLLQVDYSVPADLTAHAPSRSHLIGLGLRHQDGLAAPQRTAVRVEVSFDEGATWRQVWAFGQHGTWQAVIPAGQGSVSLRVHAKDGAGNAVRQTVIRAYGLR